MDDLVQHISEGDNTTSYTLPELWHYPLTNSANATSFGEMNNLSVRMAREHDPMLTDHCSNAAATFNKRRESAHNVNANAGITNNESEVKRMKTRGGNKDGESKKEGEEDCGDAVAKTGDAVAKTAKPLEPPKQDYIHVRARRGQATDSHSLAERARREKISERMKILQDLVPGCNKVIGKALVLDEIINYIQSLQRQVEFLSLKLEAVNSRAPPGIESFPSKEFAQQQAYDASSLGFSSQAARGYEGTSPEWLHMQLGGGFERTS